MVSALDMYMKFPRIVTDNSETHSVGVVTAREYFQLYVYL